MDKIQLKSSQQITDHSLLLHGLRNFVSLVSMLYFTFLWFFFLYAFSDTRSGGPNGQQENISNVGYTFVFEATKKQTMEDKTVYPIRSKPCFGPRIENSWEHGDHALGTLKVFPGTHKAINYIKDVRIAFQAIC